jgi:hypothetical protein
MEPPREPLSPLGFPLESNRTVENKRYPDRVPRGRGCLVGDAKVLISQEVSHMREINRKVSIFNKFVGIPQGPSPIRFHSFLTVE